MLAAQDQTRKYKVVMVKKKENPKKCQIGGDRDETEMHLISEGEKLAQDKYKKRLNRMVSTIHWELCAFHGAKRNRNWYDQRPKMISIAVSGDFRVKDK